MHKIEESMKEAFELANPTPSKQGSYLIEKGGRWENFCRFGGSLIHLKDSFLKSIAKDQEMIYKCFSYALDQGNTRVFS